MGITSQRGLAKTAGLQKTIKNLSRAETARVVQQKFKHLVALHFKERKRSLEIKEPSLHRNLQKDSLDINDLPADCAIMLLAGTCKLDDAEDWIADPYVVYGVTDSNVLTLGSGSYVALWSLEEEEEPTENKDSDENGKAMEVDIHSSS